jgi:DNA-binding GntR family transcriptional regulator
MSPKNDNVASRATEQLREGILFGVWVPGSRLSPAALAKQFELSTTIIRESLTRLAGEGLIKILPNRGFFIPELSLRELSDLTELRIVSEALALRLSLTRGDLEWESDLISAHHLLARTQRRSPSDPNHFTPEWERRHQAFHQALIAGSGCETMVSLSANLATKTSLYRQWAAPSPAAQKRDIEREHQAILDAALARDVDGAIELLSAHYQRTVDVVLKSGLASEAINSGA